MSWTFSWILSWTLYWTKDFLSTNLILKGFYSQFLHQTSHFKDFCKKQKIGENFQSPTLSWTLSWAKDFLNPNFILKVIFFHNISTIHDILRLFAKKKKKIGEKFLIPTLSWTLSWTKDFVNPNFILKGFLFIISPSNMTYQGFLEKKKVGANFPSPTLFWTLSWKLS